MKRQRRDRRRAGTRIELSPRDEALLRALARFRVARTRDLTDLVFRGVRPDTAAQRLRRLFDAGFLDVQAGDRSKESVYSLGPKARDWLAARGDRLGRRPSGRIEHHLDVVRAWVQLALAVHELPGLALERLRPDWELREHLGAPTGVVLPDALAHVRLTAGGEPVHVRLALEVDRGSEDLSILAAKLGGYERLLASQGGLLGWREIGLAVVLTPKAQGRGQAIQRLLTEGWSSWWLLWDEDEGPVRALAELREAVLGPLTASPDESPCCKGSSDAVTAEEADTSVGEGWELSDG